MHSFYVGHPPLYVTFSVTLSAGGLSVSHTPYFTVTVHHVIIIFGTLVKNDDVSRCFFHFCQISIFQAVRGVKGKKIAQNEKKKNYMSHTIYQKHYSILFLVHFSRVIPVKFIKSMPSQKF